MTQTDYKDWLRQHLPADVLKEAVALVSAWWIFPEKKRT